MYNPNEAKIIRESSCGYHLIPIQDEMLSHREVELVGEVDADSANALIRQLRYLQREDPGAWVTLYINSPGGSVDSGMALYDVMQAVSCPIRTVCVGLAASMAALLFVRRRARHAAPQSPHDSRPADCSDRRQRPEAESGQRRSDGNPADHRQSHRGTLRQKHG